MRSTSPSPLPSVVLVPRSEAVASGDGPTIDYGIIPSPFGSYLLAQTPEGIVYGAFLDTADPAASESELRTVWPQARLHHNPAAIQPLGNQIFAPAPPIPQAPLRVSVAGTPFQHQVWQALLDIPWGAVITYQDLAQRLGRPGAARAVGTALGRNSVAYLIPCHRVVRGSGNLGGFRWGLDRKAALLAWESGQAQTTLPL